MRSEQEGSLKPLVVSACRRVSVWFSVSAWCIFCLLGIPPTALASLDLRDAAVTRLENGLTVMLLEHRGIPAVSVQMLYRVGGRDEQYGGTGVAHFLEHMAFRDSENFPGTDVVGQIYAAGGEWHGYTWVDQTTYFETVPVDHLDLALRIEADRMSRLLILEQHLEPERGAVLAEMHGYENDPAMVLHDQVVFAAFQGHPYRNNVIGFESDIQQVRIEDIREFYRRHYQPSNAVLAIVGDMSAEQVLVRIKALFGPLKSTQPTPLPRTREPVQRGMRRVNLAGPAPGDHFEILYHAPSARHPDFPAFLLMQELLSGSSGVNFHQDGGTSPVQEGRLLHGVADDLRTWYPLAAQTYGFSIAGTLAAGSGQDELERLVEARIRPLRESSLAAAVIDGAKARLLRALVFDVETTEDAAHQLAYFDGLGALPVLLALPDSVSRVTAEDVRRVARTYLRPERRTVGWYLAGETLRTADVPAGVELAPAYGPRRAGSAGNPGEPAQTPTLHRLRAGLPVILQRSRASATMHLRVVFAGDKLWSPSGVTGGDPAAGYSSLGLALAQGELASGLERLAETLPRIKYQEAPGETAMEDPGARLERLFLRQLGWSTGSAASAPPTPVLVALVGDFEPSEALAMLEARLGELAPGAPPTHPAPRVPAGPLDDWLEQPVAQSALGYVVPAPGPQDSRSLAWQALLYILSHGYEGRLGKEAISRRGLVYYIDSHYRSDGEHAWISLASGVDPSKFESMLALLLQQLQQLQANPPSSEEVEQAKQHMLGRYLTAAQSNAERSEALAREWLWHGALRTPMEVRTAIDAVSRQQVLDATSDFLRGNTVSVRHRPTPGATENAEIQGPIGGQH